MLNANSFSVIGKALQPNTTELIFEKDKEGIYLRSDIELQIINENKCRHHIENFISNTVVFGLRGDRVCALRFDTDEGKKCKVFLKQHFGKKHDSIIRFFEHLENATESDTEKFANCIEIIDRKEIKSISTFPDDTHFLVTGVFFEPIEGRKRKKLFLQTVFTYDKGYQVTHQELSEELYYFSQLSSVKKFFIGSSKTSL